MSAAVLVLMLVIRTYDGFGVRARDLEVARRVSSDILHTAGIELTWTTCSPASGSAVPRECNEPAQASELLLRIAAAPRHDAEVETLGFAYVDTSARTGSLATLYADRIMEMAAASGVDIGTLLGRALAHEVGHLLLGTAAHQPGGLMRARWSASMVHRGIRKDWLFSPLEAEAIRDGLSRRLAISAAPAN